MKVSNLQEEKTNNSKKIASYFNKLGLEVKFENKLDIHEELLLIAQDRPSFQKEILTIINFLNQSVKKTSD